MSDPTKACSLTVDEIEELISWHGHNVATDFADRIDRLSYLHKRLKAFSEPISAVANEVKPTAQGWGAPSNG